MFVYTSVHKLWKRTRKVRSNFYILNSLQWKKYMELSITSSNEFDVRNIVVNAQIWFSAIDVGNVLECTNTRRFCRSHIKDKYKKRLGDLRILEGSDKIKETPHGFQSPAFGNGYRSAKVPKQNLFKIIYMRRSCQHWGSRWYCKFSRQAYEAKLGFTIGLSVL